MRNLLSKISNGVKRNEADIVLVIGVILISLISFGGGWLLSNFSNSTTTEKEAIKIEEVPLEKPQASPSKTRTTESKNQQQEALEEPEQQKEQKPSTDETQQKFVASKNGTVYHFPWCPGAQQIKEENKIYFNSREEAEKEGYRPAKNCPGL